MAYRKEYMNTRCIDWFAKIGDKWIYANSTGGFLPAKINDDNYLPLLQSICSNLPDIFAEENDEIELNDTLITNRYNRALDIYNEYLTDSDEETIDIFRNEYTLENFKNNYKQLFVNMASKGFYSFVRVNIDDESSMKYELVAYPKKTEKLEIEERIRKVAEMSEDGDNIMDYLQGITFEDHQIDFGTDLGQIIL